MPTTTTESDTARRTFKAAGIEFCSGGGYALKGKVQPSPGRLYALMGEIEIREGRLDEAKKLLDDSDGRS